MDNFDVEVHVSDDEISNTEDQVSVVAESEIAVGDESEVDETEAMSPYNFEDFAREGMVKMGEADREFETVKTHFINMMGSLRGQTTVVSVHKCLNTASVHMQARIDSFRIFSEAMAKKRGGESNVKRAWFGASKTEVCQIVSSGFSHCTDPKNDDESSSYGVGVYLDPNLSLASTAIMAVEDERGQRNVLLCRVIMGNMEEVNRGSKQILPSSRNFDSGVDNLTVPTKFIIWGAFMNSHILPEYLISFESPGLKDLNPMPKKVPTSQWMSFPLLIAALTRYLHPTRMAQIVRCYNDFRMNVVGRPQLVRTIRELAGDELLARLIQQHQLALPPNNN